jgi:hypothetical protein
LDTPGTSPGTLSITGTYAQTSAGAINLELSGLTAGSQYDRLGRVKSTTDNIGNTKSLVWDSRDNLIQSTDALGNTDPSPATASCGPGLAAYATNANEPERTGRRT